MNYGKDECKKNTEKCRCWPYLSFPFSIYYYTHKAINFWFVKFKIGIKKNKETAFFFAKIQPSFDFNSLLFRNHTGKHLKLFALFLLCYFKSRVHESEKRNHHNNDCYQSDCLSICVEFLHQIKANQPQQNRLKIGFQSKWRTSSEYSLCQQIFFCLTSLNERKFHTIDIAFRLLKTNHIPKLSIFHCYSFHFLPLKFTLLSYTNKNNAGKKTQSEDERQRFFRLTFDNE